MFSFSAPFEQSYRPCFTAALVFLKTKPIASPYLAPIADFSMTSHAFSPSLVSLMIFLYIVIFHLY